MNDLPPTLLVAIVDDDDDLRVNLQAIVSSVADMRCVGAFGTAEEAILKLPASLATVVLMDINLPKANGITCVARLAPKMPLTHFLMLTVNDDSEAIFNSLAAGAIGYLRKPMEPSELIQSIREAKRGGAPMSSSIARRVIQAFRKTPSSQTAEQDGRASVLEKLAPREREILELLARGHLQKEIADELGISFSTVRTLTGRIYEKLHVHSRGQAVAKYLGAGEQSG